MRRLVWFFLLLAICAGCPPKDPKNPDPNTNGNGTKIIPANDPLWERLDALVTNEPDAAKEGACAALIHLNNERGRKLLAKCFEPFVTEPKESSELRRNAVDLMASTGGPEVTATLQKLLADTKGEVRGKAAEALLRLKDPSGIDILIAYKGGYNTEHSGLYWLVRNVDLLPKDFAIKAASSQDDLTRKNAAILLGLIGGDEALETVSNLSIDPDKDIQAYARKVQDKLADAPNFLAELKKDLKSKNKVQRFTAVEFLGYYGRALGEDDVRATLGAALTDPDSTVQIKAVESLTLLGGAGSSALLAGRLSTADNTLAGRILAALTELKDPSALDAVLAFADKADLNSRGIDLANCFIAFNDKKALPFAQKLIASQPIFLKRAGARMVASLGAEEAIWKPLLEDKDPETKGMAMIAAVKGGAKEDSLADYRQDADLLINTYAHVASLLAKGQ